MELLLLMLMFAAAVLAVPPVSQPIETAYMAKKEYIYKYESQVISGLPVGSNIYSGIKVKGQIRFQKMTIQEMKMEIQKPRLFKIVGPIEVYNPTREILPDDAWVELTGTDADLMKSTLIKPIKFNYMRGHIEDVVTEGDDLDWSVNIKKGALSLLEVNFNDRHSLTPDTLLDTSTPKPTLYKVIEASVSGECETSYKLTPFVSTIDGTPSMEVFKVRNFDRCMEPVFTTRTMVDGIPCNKMFEVMSGQSSVHYSMLGGPGEYIIVSAVGESQYNLVPYTEKQGRLTTFSNQRLMLIDSRPISDQISEPKSPKVLDFPLLMKTEEQRQWKSSSNIPSLEVTYRQEQVDMVMKVLSGLEPLMKDKVEQEVTILMHDLYHLLVTLDKTGLETIIKSVDQDPARVRARKILLDMLPTVGTHAAVDVLLYRFETKPPSTLQTAISLMTLGMMPQPDIPIVKRLMDFIEKMDKPDPIVKRAAWLCLGSLGNKMIKTYNTETKDMKKQEAILAMLRAESNDVLLKEKLDEKLEILKDYMDQTEKLYMKAKGDIIKMVEDLFKLKAEDEKLLALKTMRNMAFLDFLPTLESVIIDRDMPMVHRMVALMTLKKREMYSPYMVNKILLPLFFNRAELEEICGLSVMVNKILLPLFFDRAELEEIRGLSIMVALMIGVPRPELEMIAHYMDDEPSEHMQALVSSVLTQLSNVTSPCVSCIKSVYNSTLALRLARKAEPGFQKSNFLYESRYDNELEMGQVYEQIMLYSSKHKLPRAMASSLTHIGYGKATKFLEFGYVAEGLDGVLDKILEDPSLGGVSELVRKILHPRKPRSVSDPEQYIKDIKEKLEVKPRKFEPLKGIVHVSLYGRELIYFDIDKLLPQKEAPQGKLSPVLPDISAMLDPMKQLLKTQRSNVLPLRRVIWPTEAGLPLILDTKMIGAFKTDGDIQIKMDPKMSGKSSLLSQFDALVRWRMSFAGQAVLDMYTEMKTIRSGLSLKAKINFYLPATLSVNMDLEKYKLIVKITDQTKFEPVWMELKPLAFICIVPTKAAQYPIPPEEMEITLLDGAEMETISYDIGEMFLGRKLMFAGMKAVRMDNGRTLPSISGKQYLHVRYDPMSYKDLDIQFQHVRVQPKNPSASTSSQSKSSWWPMTWLLAPSDQAPPKYEDKDPQLEMPSNTPVKGFINLAEDDLTISYLKSKFSKEVDILKSGDKCGLVVRLADPGSSPRHEVQLSTLYQRDEDAHKHLYTVEIRRRPVINETSDWKMVTSMKVDMPVVEIEPSDLEDNQYQHEIEQHLQELMEEPIHQTIDPKTSLLLHMIKDLTGPKPEISTTKLLESIISYVLDKETDDSVEDLKMLLQKQRILYKKIDRLYKQEIKPFKKRDYIEFYKAILYKFKLIINEVGQKLDDVAYGEQKPEEAVLILYTLAKQKLAVQKLVVIKQKLQPLLILNEKIDIDKILVELRKECDMLREKQENHSLNKQPLEKNKATLEIDPRDRDIYTDLMTLEKHMILIKLIPKSKLADPLMEKKSIITKLDTAQKDLKEIIDQLDAKLIQKVNIGKIMRIKIIEILLHQRLIVLDLSDSRVVERFDLIEKNIAVTYPTVKDIDVKTTLKLQKEKMIDLSKKIMNRLLIAVEAINDFRSLVSLTTPDEQRQLKELQKLKLKQLMMLEHLQDIELHKYTLKYEIGDIKDMTKDVKDIIHLITTDVKTAALSPVVIRGLQILTRQIPVIEKAMRIVKETILTKVAANDPDASKYVEMKDTVIHMKIDVIKEIEKIEKLHLEDVKKPYAEMYVSVPLLLKKTIKLEAMRVKLRYLVEEALEKLDKVVTPDTGSYVYQTISQASKIQTDIETLTQLISYKLAELPKVESVTEVMTSLYKKQEGVIELLKLLEAKLKLTADIDHSLYQPLQDVQKLKDRALRHELKIAELKKEYKKLTETSTTSTYQTSLPARNSLPQRRLLQPMKTTVIIKYGLIDGTPRTIQMLVFGRKSHAQLLWEKAQSWPDSQDAYVSRYLSNKLIKDDRTALAYSHIKHELNTYRHLHIICTYEDGLPVYVRSVAWWGQEWMKLIFYKKVTLVMPDKTNIPNTLDIMVDINKDNRMMDIKMKTPYETNIYHHLVLPGMCRMAAKPHGRPVMEQVVHSMTGASTVATCEMSKDHIKTLLNTRYELYPEVKSCEKVLAMDCGLTNKVAITSKPAKDQLDMKIIKIHTSEHKVEVIPATSDIEVYIDDAKIDINKPFIIGKLYLYKLLDGSIEVRLPELGLTMITDGIKTSIKANKMLGPKLCGLCGELTPGVGSDLLDPHQVPISQPLSFVSTYVLHDSTVCDATALQKKYNVPQIRKMEKMVPPVERTEVLTLDKQGKVCFSRDPVKSCPFGAQPEGIHSVLVSYYCLHSSHSRVPTYLEMAKTQYIAELQYKRISKNTYVPVPTDCVAE